jgi:hypothetical protein
LWRRPGTQEYVALFGTFWIMGSESFWMVFHVKGQFRIAPKINLNLSVSNRKGKLFGIPRVWLLGNAIRGRIVHLWISDRCMLFQRQADIKNRRSGLPEFADFISSLAGFTDSASSHLFFRVANDVWKRISRLILSHIRDVASAHRRKETAVRKYDRPKRESFLIFWRCCKSISKDQHHIRMCLRSHNSVHCRRLSCLAGVSPSKLQSGEFGLWLGLPRDSGGNSVSNHRFQMLRIDQIGIRVTIHRGVEGDDYVITIR